jgi:hypothetical protein
MKGKFVRVTSLRLSVVLGAVGALGLVKLLPGCSDPTGLDKTSVTATGGGSSGGMDLSGSFNESCPADPTWIPGDGGLPPPVPMIDPAPHPDTECPFYRGAYQNFMIAGTPLPNGDPLIVNYATIEDTFQTQYPTGFTRNTGSLDPKTSPDPCVNAGGQAGATAARSGPASGRAWLGAIKQAGFRNILIDQDGHTLYYGLHMNQAFVDFVAANNLQTPAGILKVDPTLPFPPGVVEFKTAWKDIDPRDFPASDGTYCHTDPTLVPAPTSFASDPGDYSNYITTMAWVPWIHQDPTTKAITEDPDHPILRKVALVAIHSVYTLPGHPEFVWGSIQHVNLKEVDPDPLTFAGVSILGRPDSQPTATGDAGIPALPDPMDPSNSMVKEAPDTTNRYLLYSPGTLESQSMKPLTDLDLTLNEANQVFPKSQATQVYRVFAGAKADQLSPDGAVFSFNSNLNALFQNAITSGAIDPKVDKRQHYRLVAAVWMDKPALFGLGPKQQNGSYNGLTLQNDDTSPLVVAAKAGDPRKDISQGVSCGVPIGPNGKSGDVPGVTALENTVPGCDTRADDLHLATANNPTLVSGPDGGPVDPSADFINHTAGTDSPFSLLGGEDRLSSTSMETFTQNVQFFNCFSCHNTQPINADGVAADPTCLTPPLPPGCTGQPETIIPFAAKINVSHMFSEFLLREEDARNRAAGN